jgi:hypothetical protein
MMRQPHKRQLFELQREEHGKFCCSSIPLFGGDYMGATTCRFDVSPEVVNLRVQPSS